MSDVVELYRDDHLLVTQHRGTTVAVRTGRDPDAETPTLVDAVDLHGALGDFLNSEVSDGGD